MLKLLFILLLVALYESEGVHIPCDHMKSESNCISNECCKWSLNSTKCDYDCPDGEICTYEDSFYCTWAVNSGSDVVQLILMSFGLLMAFISLVMVTFLCVAVCIYFLNSKTNIFKQCSSKSQHHDYNKFDSLN